jgi:hypothetical protein
MTLKFKLTSIAFPNRTPKIISQTVYEKLKASGKIKHFTVETIRVKESPIPDELKELKKTKK